MNLLCQFLVVFLLLSLDMESFLLCYLSLLLSLSPPLQNTSLGEKDHFSQESHDCTDNFVIDIVAAGSLENEDREKNS